MQSDISYLRCLFTFCFNSKISLVPIAKQAILFLSLVFILSIKISAQNTPPKITDIIAEVDPVKKCIHIKYDLSDQEDDNISVSLRFSNDGGKTFPFHADSINGSAGYPVSPGEREIFCYYNPMLINPSSDSFALKFVADDKYKVPIEDITSKVDTQNLRTDMDLITGIRHYIKGQFHLKEVKDLIEQRFLLNNLLTSKDMFDFSGYSASNIIGEKQGQINEDTVYILCSHFDSVPQGPGADDNGSGVAGMLEAMRVLSSGSFHNTIKFIGFDLEELGLKGSQRYAANALAASEIIAGVIDYEMIGYFSENQNSQSFPIGFDRLFPEVYASSSAHGSKGNFIANVANTRSESIRYEFESCAGRYVPLLNTMSLSVTGNGETVSFFRRSDHAPFWDNGFKALMLTDCAEYRNPNYHKESDTTGTIDFSFMANVVKATVATIATLAKPVHCTVEVIKGSKLTSVSENHPLSNFQLSQNYPNPFNPSTTISYSLPKETHIELKVFDMLGREVTTLVNRDQNVGEYKVQFDGSFLPSGIYVYTIQAGQFRDSKKLVLLK
ncbi:MAG: M20/M25/M40 family metallo-hydrolase [Syntrophomonadaceae bacterium]